jgi:molybdate transport system substrate-binding protein
MSPSASLSSDRKTRVALPSPVSEAANGRTAMRKIFGIAFAVAISAGAFGDGAARAGEVKLLSALVMKPALTELASGFEGTTGHKLTIAYDSAGAVNKRVQSGETADIAILQKPAVDALIRDGKMTSGSNVTVGRSGVAAAVRKGAPKPDIASVDSFKRALLDAQSIAYPVPDTGHASGIHFLMVIERLGIASQVNSKAKLMDGTVAEFAARDSADIVISQPMEILATPGYELIGWLPEELQDREKFTWAAGITTNAKEPEAARALIQFLSSPAAAAAIKKKGMEPG